MKCTSTWVLLVVLAVFSAPESVRAGLITSSPGEATVVDFSQFGGTFIPTFTGPVEIGGLVGESITWQVQTTNWPAGIGNQPYDLVFNGTWGNGRNGFTGLNNTSTNDYMEYIFNAGPVASVGGFLNYMPQHTPAIIEVIGNIGQVLESIDIAAVAPISTPGQVDAGGFRGISRATNDIYAFRVRGAGFVLDDLSFLRNAEVPLPTSLILLLAGLIGLIGSRKPRNR